MICELEELEDTGEYTWDQLDDRAKDRARDKCRETHLDYDWWDLVYEDVAHVADLLGIDLRQKAVKLMNGQTRYDPCIWFSGFCCQGDGACFEGLYEYKKGSIKAVKEYAPQDETLHRIARDLADAQRKVFYSAAVRIGHSGNYYHKYSMTVDVECNLDGSKMQAIVDHRLEHDGVEKAIQEALGDFADWIYKRLEDEHDHLMSDECIDEYLSDQVFDEDGDIV
jgi:hypothetical protein